MTERMSSSVELPAVVSISALAERRQLSLTGDLLARAFAADPVLCHAEPNAVRRAGWMSLLYRACFRYAAATGGVELVDERAAVLWLQSETEPPFWRGILHGSLRVMLALGWRAAWRCLRHEAWCAARVHALGLQRFGYIWILGVDPVAQREGLGRRALGAALASMRAHGHEVCILKTECRSNVAFYLGLGFEILDEYVVPATQLRCWLFRRGLG
ncbi:MAG: GNAT family N-acetyltransferase [Deltaproteobacteria bacterium]